MKKEKAGFKEYVPQNPATAEELVNKYGTYNIQPTADTENEFPCIAQGKSKKTVSKINKKSSQFQ